MARSIEVDVTALVRAMQKAPHIFAQAAKDGMHDALDAWKAEATDLAPLEKGTLRRSISTKVRGSGIGITGEISAMAVEASESGRRFNYAYYLHEVYPEKNGPSFKHPTTDGTIPEFIDKPAEEKGEEWIRGVEDEIKRALAREGWR